MATQSMTRKSAATILNSRKLVNKPGKFTLKVTSAANFIRSNKDGSKTPVTIVNFAAMTPYQLGQAQEHFKAGDFQEATNLNLSASQLAGQYVPAKGEIVDVEVDTIQNNEGIDILVVSSIVPRQAEKAASITGFSAEDSSLDIEDMRDALIEAGMKKVAANKLSDEEVEEAYAELEETTEKSKTETELV